jgi:GPH family glycoside/pentoside/hexuronide:cation symporter
MGGINTIFIRFSGSNFTKPASKRILASIFALGVLMNQLSDVVPASTSLEIRRLSMPTLFGFSLGMIGDRIFRDAPALLLLLFMTNYLAIPAALAGTAIFIPKILIVFVDPMVGTLSDRLRTPWGRRRPMMLIGAIFASIAIVAFFHVPHFASTTVEAAYLSLIIFLGFTGYSFYTVPCLVMSSEIAEGAEERRRVMSWRVAFMAIGLSCSAYAGAFVQYIGGGQQGYRSMSLLYGAICGVTMLATVFSSAGLATTQMAGTAPSIISQFKLVAANRRYLMLLLTGFLQKLGEGVGYGSFAYFCIYVVHQNLAGIGDVVLASMAGQILAQPLWLKASKKYSPITLYAVGVFGWCLNLLLWLAMRDQSSWWLIPLGLEAGVAAGGFLMVTLGMLSQVMAADTAATGQDREGVYSGLWLANEKLAFAGGALIVGVVLGLFGFASSSSGMAASQSATAVFGIGFTYVGINMIIYVSSILVLRQFGKIDSPVAGSRLA